RKPRGRRSLRWRMPLASRPRRFERSRPEGRSKAGEDRRGSDRDFQEQGEMNMKTTTNKRPCPNCGGKGIIGNNVIAPVCALCNGKGWLRPEDPDELRLTVTPVGEFHVPKQTAKRKRK